MAIYLWEAKTRLGEPRKGEMEAASTGIVTQRLRAQQLQVTKIKRKPINIQIRLPGQTGVTTRDLVIFTRQFATMIDAGLPLVQCMEILGNQNDNPDFKKIIMEVKTSVESGTTLADALGRHPKVFNRLFVNLVQAGETAGNLDLILNRLSAYIEKNMKLVKQVKGAMTYPILVLGVSVIVSLVLLLFVIPIFQKMFGDFGKALPAPTQFVIDISEFARRNVIWIFIILGGIIGGTIAAIKNPKGRWFVDTMLLHMPVFGPMFSRIAVARFSRTLGTMLSSGVPMLEAMEIVAGTAGNVVVEKAIRYVRTKVSEGKTMAQPLSEVKVFPAMVVQMISVGESTGAMDTMLNKIADFYDDEVDAAVGTMTAMLEPLIMAFLAVILGGLVISMYLPVFSMAGSIGSH